MRIVQLQASKGRYYKAAHPFDTGNLVRLSQCKIVSHGLCPMCSTGANHNWGYNKAGFAPSIYTKLMRTLSYTGSLCSLYR